MHPNENKMSGGGGGGGGDTAFDPTGGKIAVEAVAYLQGIDQWVHLCFGKRWGRGWGKGVRNLPFASVHTEGEGAFFFGVKAITSGNFSSLPPLNLIVDPERGGGSETPSDEEIERQKRHVCTWALEKLWELSPEGGGTHTVRTGIIGREGRFDAWERRGVGISVPVARTRLKKETGGEHLTRWIVATLPSAKMQRHLVQKTWIRGDGPCRQFRWWPSSSSSGGAGGEGDSALRFMRKIREVVERASSPVEVVCTPAGVRLGLEDKSRRPDEEAERGFVGTMREFSRSQELFDRTEEEGSYALGASDLVQDITMLFVPKAVRTAFGDVVGGSKDIAGMTSAVEIKGVLFKELGSEFPCSSVVERVFGTH